MQKLLAIFAMSALAGCSSMPTPSPMAGTWRGDLNCPSSRLSAQDITIKLEDGIFPGLLTGEIENHAVRDGIKYYVRYTVTGATVGGKVKLKPEKMITNTSGDLLYGLVFEADRVSDDSMILHFKRCNQDKTFNRIQKLTASK
jgi:hypothetical protein